MIRFDLNVEHDEVYGKFVLTVCICSILHFCKKFADCKKTDSASLSQEVYLRLEVTAASEVLRVETIYYLLVRYL